MTDSGLPPPEAAPDEADMPFAAWWARHGGTVRRIGLWVAPVLAAAILLYYPVGMALVHVIDDDPDFAPAPATVAGGQDRAVAMAAALVRREVDIHKWTPNDPFFQPSWALDDMPAFQQGIVAAVARFTDDLNRSRPGGDDDLQRAAGLLKYPGTIWMFDPSTSWAPTASAEKQYRAAARALEHHNVRIVRGDAALDPRPEALAALVQGVVAELGILAATIDGQVTNRRWIDLKADDVFYAAKGRLYAYSLLMRELGSDYGHVLADRELAARWRQAVDSLRLAASLSPAVVVNGAPDALLLPNHLAAQGFYLQRARTHLAGIEAALAK
ncbi:MAG: DUF2333 family protein [Solirubrobacterales bacterium]